MKRWWALAFVISCTSPNPEATNGAVTCGAQVSCPTGGKSYKACGDGATCVFSGSDGTSIACVSCNDCVAAASQIISWCGMVGGTTGGGTTGGGTTGGGTTGGGTTGGGTTGGGTTGGPQVACPAVLIILDRSGSMDADLNGGTGTPKLDLAKTAIKKLVQKHADQFAFGLETFTDEAFSPMCDSGVDLLVDPAFNTGTLIQNQLANVFVGGTTNTAAAFVTAGGVPALLDASRPAHAILLITDGAPNCLGTATDLSSALAQVQTTTQDGIVTFVVALGTLTAADDDGINQIAQACPQGTCSGASCDGNSYFPALTATSLDATLEAIAVELAHGSCNR